MTRTGSTAQRLQLLPYTQRVCRIEHYPTSLQATRKAGAPDPAVYALMEREVAAIADAGTEVWSIASERGRGLPLWPSQILPTPEDVDPQLIPRFLELAHARNIIVLGYYPFIFTKPLAALHPEWLIQMLDDGQPEVWNEGWFCWNSPYRDWLPLYLSELLDTLEFDGIYFDDMNWGAHSDTGQRRAGGCCCPYCQALYHDETGRELPHRVDMESPDFARYVNWRYEKFQVAVAHVAKQIHARHPHAILDWNYYGRPYGSPDTGWKSAHPLNPLQIEGTHFFMEAGLDNLGVNLPVKLLKACGPSFGLWLWATQIAPEVASHSAPYPEPHTAMLYGLSAVANGGASLTTCLDAGDHTIYGDALKSVFAEVKRLRPYVGGAPVRHLALHLSQQTRDFGYAHKPDEFWRLMRGSNEMLKRGQQLTDVLFDQQLRPETLAGYRILFLSNSRSLSDAQIAAIRDFVAQGGTLLATHESSLWDELGQRRSNFGLADLLGVNWCDPGGVEPNLRRTMFGDVDPAESNIYVPQTAALRQQFGHLVAFGAAQSAVECRSGSRVQVLYTKSTLQWGEQPPLGHFDPGAQQDSGLPAVTVNRFGRGQAIYICGDLGEGYDRNPLPQLQRFLTSLVRTAAAPPIEVTSARTVSVTAWLRKPRELMIHLLNDALPYLPWATSASDRRKYFYLDQVLPVHDVTVALPGYRAAAASLPLRGQTLPLQGEPQTLTVPQIHLHELIRVELL